MNKIHSLHVADGKIEIGGIEEIVSFGEKEAVFCLGERRLVVEGAGLTCESVDVEGGNAVLSGEVRAVTYKASVTAKGFIKKLFK